MNTPLEEPTRFFFPKKERLCHKRAFEYLFEHGSSVRAGMLKFFYVLDPPEALADQSVQIAFAVSKRNFKHAVKRNLMKRRLKEAYRLHAHPLRAHLTDSQRQLWVIVIYQNRSIVPYHQIERLMRKGLHQLRKKAGFRIEN
ncbi:MAG: ribonuclease P protein component [Bacteroidota bacterium]